MRVRPANQPTVAANLLRLIAVAALCVAGLAFGGGVGGGAAAGGNAPDPDRPPTPRELYNLGTADLRQGKLRDAEARLQSAVASQDDRVQVAALYNLGHVRYQDGEHDRTNAPDTKAVGEKAQRAALWGDDVLKELDAALPGSDVQEMVTAYLRGRGARKELKSAIEVVQKAMDTYGAVLTKWRRSSGDFHSAAELHPSDTNALKNGELVDREIAKLIDQMKMSMMMPGKGDMTEKREQIRKKMEELKKKMPAEAQDKLKSPGGEEEEDDEGGKQERKEPKPGQEEGPNKNGREMKLSPEDAARLLGMLKLDADRKLPMGGMEEGSKPEARKGRDW